MALKGTRNLNAGARIAMVFGFAGLWAYAWNFFGVIGNGTLPLGLLTALFLYAFFGNRKKAAFEFLPVAACLIVATAGPLFANGLLPQAVPLWQSAMLGFSFLPLLGLGLGCLLSRRTYRAWELAVLLLIFYGILLPLRFFAAPRLLPAAQDAKALCWAVACTAAAVATTAIAAVWKKDGVLAALAFGTDALCAAVAVAATLLQRRVSWSTETVGLLAWAGTGALLMLLLVLLPRSLLAGEGKFKYRSPIGSRHLRCIYDAVFVLFFTALLPLWQLCATAAALLHWSRFDPRTYLLAALPLLILIFCFGIARKNTIVRCLHVPVKARPEEFALRALPAIVGICVLCDVIQIAAEAFANRQLQGGFLPALQLAAAMPMRLSLCGALLFFLSYAVAAKCAKLHKR